MNIRDFDKYLSENCVKSDIIAVHPDLIRWSEDKSRFRIEVFSEMYFCYRIFDNKTVLMGEAMNEDDANAWVDTNKEIVMWT